MGVFAYRAADASGQMIAGTVAADTPRQARDQLRRQGLRVRRLRSRRARQGLDMNLAGLRERFERRRRTDLITLVRELATLLGVGVPLLDALSTLSRQHDGPLRTAILELHDQVAAGLSLAEAMARQPRLFDELTISMVQVGQSSGTLDEVLERVAEFKQRAASLRGRIVGALIYPAIVLLVGIGVSIFLMTFVVPNLLAALLEAGRPLPLATRLVKGASDLLLSYGWVLPIAIVLLALGVAAVRRHPKGRAWSDRLLLRLPLIGSMLLKQEVMRLAIVMSTLLRSGVEFVRALQIAQHTSRNVIVRQSLVRCEQAVGAGREIAESLGDSQVFSPMVLQIFAVGQQSGRLEEMLDRLAADHDQQLQTAAQRLTAVLEPVLILALAVIVGLIAFATMMPILEAGNVL